MLLVYNIIVFIFGAVIGSFLNVCIYRIPDDKLSIVKPSSFCPKCNANIKYRDNIPIISFILLGFKCRNCSKSIPVIYPLVEFLTAIVFLIVFNNFDYQTQISSIFVYFIFSAILIVITFIDIKHFIIPDSLNLFLLIIGFLSLLFNRFPFDMAAYQHLSFSGRLFNSFLGVLTGGGVWLIITIIGNKIYFKKIGREAMGMGDVKLFAALGAFFPPKMMLVNMYLSVLIGGLCSILIMFFFKKSLKDNIPFGPFIAIASMITLLYYDVILEFFNTIFIRGY